MSVLLAIALLLLLFGIIGGIAIAKFLFFIIAVAVVLALVGIFTRRTA